MFDLGPKPDLFNPEIYPQEITTSVYSRSFWLSSDEPAFWDDGEITEAYAFDISHPEVTYPLDILERLRPRAKPDPDTDRCDSADRRRR